MSDTVAIIGGGVIGSGWAARFLLNGWHVNFYDPDPAAATQCREVLRNARRSLPGLLDVAMPGEGKLRIVSTVEEAVAGAGWIQESVPERLAVKHEVFAQIQQVASPQAVVASSTSGFKPSDLARESRNPGQILVCHPFNPVYLLPLVEVVGPTDHDGEILARVQKILLELGMKPLLVRHEIDAHIADRLLEAVWREALWLIDDDVASTAEIDDAIRFGFGLRWAQMGLFETYRIAGGEKGMAHFLAQFGPCLQWPWSKLTEVPELSDRLVSRIAEQSDQQSGHLSIRDLERIRDNNLVTILRALKAQDWGAGQILNQQDRQLNCAIEEADLAQAIVTVNRAVPLDWTDYNGHMTESRYLEVFGDATDRFMKLIGCDAQYIAGGSSFFTVETHIRHVLEVHAGARVRVATQCLSGEGKKMQLFHRLTRDDGELLATGEHMLVHVSLETRRSSSPAPQVAEKLGKIASLHAGLPAPEGVGAAVGRR